MTIRAPSVVVAAVCFGSAGSVPIANADHVTYDDRERLSPATLTAEVGGATFEFSSGTQRERSHLHVRAMQGGTTLWTWPLQWIGLGHRDIPLHRLSRLRLTRFSDGALYFSGRLRRQKLSCSLSVYDWKATCSRNESRYDDRDFEQPYGDEPPRYNYDISALTQVSRACDDVFVTKQDELACVDALQPFGAAANVITRACDDAFVSTAATMMCLQSARGNATTFAQNVSECDRAFVSEDITNRCIQTVSGGRHAADSAAILRACDNAFVGESSTLACLGAVATTRYDPTQLVKFCDDQNVGEADALACLARYQ